MNCEIEGSTEGGEGSYTPMANEGGDVDRLGIGSADLAGLMVLRGSTEPHPKPDQ